MAKLDAFDLRILARLQEDASLPLAELAEAVGLSSTPCWRRVQKLEAAGYIRKRVALLDRDEAQGRRHRLHRGQDGAPFDGMARALPCRPSTTCRRSSISTG